MQNIILLNLLTAAIVFSAAAAYLLRGDEKLSKKLARIRVRIHDYERRRMPKPQREEYEQTAPAEMFLFGALLLIILMMMQAA